MKNNPIKDKIILNSIKEEKYWYNGNNVFSKYIKKSLNPRLSKNNYYVFNIYYKSKRYTVSLHRFIWIWYNQRVPKDSYVIDHIDGNTTNNNISNLQEITIKQNAIKAKTSRFDIEDIKQMERLHNLGYEPLEICKLYNLDQSHYRFIRKNNFKDKKSLFKTGPKGLGKEIVINIKKELKKGARNIDLAKKYNCNPRSISKIKNGERWKEINI